jgi:hypothetical protein
VRSLLVGLAVACAELEAPAPVGAPPPRRDDFPRCQAAVDPPRIRGSIEIALRSGPGVPPWVPEQVVSEILGFYGDHGLQIDVGIVPDGISIEQPFVPGSTLEAQVAPLRELVDDVARPARPAVEVVVLRDLLGSDDVVEALGSVAGLTLRPGQSLGPELDAALGLDAPFTPIVLLSAFEWDRARPDAPRLTAPHEVGHALGLDHRPGSRDLMSTEVVPCWPTLDAEQVARIERDLRR